MNLNQPSKKYRLNARDFLRGLAIAALTPVAVLAQQSIEAGELHIDPKVLGMSAIGGALAYLIKNLFTGKTEPKEGEQLELPLDQNTNTK